MTTRDPDPPTADGGATATLHDYDLGGRAYSVTVTGLGTAAPRVSDLRWRPDDARAPRHDTVAEAAVRVGRTPEALEARLVDDARRQLARDTAEAEEEAPRRRRDAEARAAEGAFLSEAARRAQEAGWVRRIAGTAGPAGVDPADADALRALAARAGLDYAGLLPQVEELYRLGAAGYRAPACGCGVDPFEDTSAAARLAHAASGGRSVDAFASCVLDVATYPLRAPAPAPEPATFVEVVAAFERRLSAAGGTAFVTPATAAALRGRS